MVRLSNWAAILVPLLVVLPLVAGTPIVGVSLRDIRVLQFESDRYAYRMRSPGLPQLQCVGLHCGYGSGHLHMAECTNTGLDDEYEVVWACTAMVDAGYKLDGAKVICEEFSGPGDAYVTPGSCVLEYSLRRTYTPPPPPSHTNAWDAPIATLTQYGFDPVGSIVQIVIVVGALLLLRVYVSYLKARIRLDASPAPRPAAAPLATPPADTPTPAISTKAMAVQ